jgi:hypothetical protein
MTPEAIAAVLAVRPCGAGGAGKPSETEFCFFPDVCDRTRQCSNWLRNGEGCAEVHQMKLRLERMIELTMFARDAKLFPGGDSPTAHCTGCALLVVSRFGGELVGYWHKDNPTATAGEAEGGHDFALTDGFLVDPWLFHCYGEPPVLDLQSITGQAIAKGRYGPREKWIPV